jgi:peptide chain release factor
MIRLLATSGRGPAECRIALVKALEVMAKEAASAGLDLDIAYGPAPDRHGPGSAVVVVDGAGAAAFAHRWTGSVLWVAPSPVRPHHKRKNWFIGIFGLPAPRAAPVSLAAGELRFEAFRAGGPGGQHQNKTESAVRAVHVPSGLSVVAHDGRSQHRNKAIAIARLADLLELQADLIRSGDRMAVQANHDLLERGRPVRRFVGAGFLRG